MKARAIVPGNAGHHAVQFYSDDTRLCVSVADFLADGIAAGQPTIIIATPRHRDRIVQELAARKFDIGTLLGTGRVALFDAADTLNLFMMNGRPDPTLFRQTLGAALARLCATTDEPVVRAYGEMVDVLWRAGNCDAAIQLELLWNDLSKDYSFSLLCGYAMGPFMKQTGHADICALHNHVHAAIA
jgi:hypothetical protein